MTVDLAHTTTALVPKDARSPPPAWRLVAFVEPALLTRVFPTGAEVVLGRGAGAELRIDEPSVSRRHARLRLGPSPTLCDLGSANGTWVGERRLADGEVCDLRAGQPFEVGSVSVVVQPCPWAIDDPAADAGTSAPRSPPPEPAAATGDRTWAGAGGRGAGAAGAGLPVTAPVGALAERFLARVAESNLSILIEGETGVGKEVLARRIHRLSRRADGPFVGISCAALPEHLLESELFGYQRGAFTGAQQAKPGLFEAAEGGTLFLDEVGELPLAVQAKLLRAIETREVLRLGAVKPRAYDARFIAATNRDLEAEIAGGRFRADLYFRLNGYAITVPPLRERRDEIAALARVFVAESATRHGLPAPPRLEDDALEVLVQAPWPGNVRELRNVVERATVLAGAAAITAAHLQLERGRGREGAGGRGSAAASAAAETAPPSSLPPPASPAPPAPPAPPAAAPASEAVASDDAAALLQRLEELERARIVEALERCGGNQTQAAVVLGMSRRTLVSRLDRYGLPRPRKAGAG